MLATPKFTGPVLELRDLLNTYLEPEKVAVILRAFEVGAVAHKDQKRKTGEPYILHPVAVARILANLRMDHLSVAAAILHDTVEDTATTVAELEQRFGREVADLVAYLARADNVSITGENVLISAGGTIAWLVRGLIRASGLSGTDRMLGSLFGLGRGVLIVGLLVIVFEYAGVDADPWWQDARLKTAGDRVAEGIRYYAALGSRYIGETEG